MWLKITPNDTLLFRSGRPFSMGDDNWTDSVFPPLPSTIYGAIRTFLIHILGELEKFYRGEMKDIVGTPDKEGNLFLRNICIMFRNTLLFPLPFDILFGQQKGHRLKNTFYGPEFISTYRIPAVLINDTSEALEYLEGFIGSNHMLSYIEGDFTEVEKEVIYFLKEIVTLEPKVGIKLNRIKRTAEEDYLYSVNMIRMNDSSFVVEVCGIEQVESQIPRVDTIFLGGECKTAKIEVIDDESIIGDFELLRSPHVTLHENRFKLYFFTPAIFENGWLPRWINPDTFEGEYNGIKLRLLSCSIGKKIRIGGWDMAKGRPKRNYYAVPAGSVYYFESLDSVPVDRIIEAFHLKNLSDIYPEQGFGNAIVATV